MESEPAVVVPTPTLAEALADPEAQKRARDAIATFPGSICVRCFGRIYSRLDRTRNNPAIGVDVVAALKLNALPVDDPACVWCEGIFGELEHFADLVCTAASEHEFDTLVIGTKVHSDIQKLEAAAEDYFDEAMRDWYEPMKTELNREVGAIALPRMGKEVDFDRPDVVVMFDPYFDRTEIEANPTYIQGRYRKYDRTIPQTHWPCNRCQGSGCAKCNQTGQQYGTSVEGLIQTEARLAYAAPDSSFHGGGREDIDALMLGTGRPFVLELKRPRYRKPRDVAAEGAPVIDLDELTRRINASTGGRVEVEGLAPADRSVVVAVKEAALDKAYRAHVTAESPISRADLEVAVDTVTCAVLQQRTPARVAHRRADKVRERTVHSVSIVSFGHHERADFEAGEADSPADDQTAGAPADSATQFTLDIVAESGTYIKELISGDDGRTVPSFGGLLEVAMRVEALDVVGVGTNL